MSLERGYKVKCDECGSVRYWDDYQISPYFARAEAKRGGWGRITVGRDASGAVRKDYCPKCLDKIAEDVL